MPTKGFYNLILFLESWLNSLTNSKGFLIVLCKVYLSCPFQFNIFVTYFFILLLFQILGIAAVTEVSFILFLTLKSAYKIFFIKMMFLMDF